MKVKALPYSQLANANLSGVARHLAFAFDDFPREEARPAIEAFSAKSTEFHESIRQITASIHSLNLKEMEPERDRLLGAFSRVITDATKSRNERLRDAGNRINIVLKTYGKIARLPMSRQTITTQKLLRDLYANGNGAYLAMIPGATELATHIENLNDEFADNYNTRIDIRKEIEKGLTLRLQGELIKSLRTAVEAVNATATLFPSEEINDIIKSANAIIDQAKINLANINKKPRKVKNEPPATEINNPKEES